MPESPSAPVERLAYRSLARATPGPDALQTLLQQARKRNANEKLTGLLVYDHGHYVQWLEGPADGLDRVWSSICRDARHASIERLNLQASGARLFPGWGMQYGAGTESPHVSGDLSLPEPSIRALRRHPEGAAEILQGLALWHALPSPTEMASAFLDASAAASEALAERITAMRPTVEALGMHVLGPLSRALGDAWLDDRCTGTDLVIAQGRLQALVRQVLGHGTTQAPEGESRRALIAAAPGEVHLAGMSFAGVALDLAGWHVRCVFPDSTRDVEQEVAGAHFDLLHLALSESLTRGDRLAELAAMIRGARAASCNPSMQVLVSGRAFAEQPGLAALIGADDLGLGYGSDTNDLDHLLHFAQVREHSPAMLLAQSTLSELALEMQRRHFAPPAARRASRGAQAVAPRRRTRR